MHSSRSRSQMNLVVLTITSGSIAACSFGWNWDSYDPRITNADISSSSSGGMGGANMSSSSGNAGSSGIGGAGGTGGAGGMGAAPCGTFALLAEDFNAPLDYDWKWDHWSDAPLTLTQVNGDFVFQSPMTGTGDYGYLQSEHAYDLHNSSVSIRVTYPSPTTPFRTSFSLHINDENYVTMSYENGKINYGAKFNGVWTDKGSFTYVAATDAYFRLREEEGSFYWETSPDGQIFTTRGQSPTSSLIGSTIGYVRFDAVVPTNAIMAGDIHLDNFNLEAKSINGWCPAATLRDGFDDTTTSFSWDHAFQDVPDCTYAESGGELVIKPSTTVSGRCGYASSSSYDLTNNAVSVEVTQMVNSNPDTSVRLAMEGREGMLQIYQVGGMLYFGHRVAGNTFDLASQTYDPVKHRFWRIRESGGKIYWDVSADNLIWNMITSLAAPFAVTELDVGLTAKTNNTVATPGEVHFDNFNIGP